MSRAATPSDLEEICAAFPDTERGTSWGDLPTWKVPSGPKGKGFVMYRRPHQNAVDPQTGEPYQDLIVILTPTEIEKAALVEDDATPFITIPHFDGYAAVLVQASRLGEISREELAEIVTDAWVKRAPKKLARDYLGDSERSGG